MCLSQNVVKLIPFNAFVALIFLGLESSPCDKFYPVWWQLWPILTPSTVYGLASMDHFTGFVPGKNPTYEVYTNIQLINNYPRTKYGSCTPKTDWKRKKWKRTVQYFVVRSIFRVCLIKIMFNSGSHCIISSWPLTTPFLL